MSAPEPAPQPTTRTPPSWRVVARVALVLLALTGLAEAGTRAWLTSPSGQISDPEIGWAWRPGVTVFNGSEGGARLRMNALGLNDDELEPTPGRRVLVLGNSFTEALQVSRAENFTSQLEAHVPGLDAVNGARSAMGPAHYPVVADRLVAPLAPDALVVALGAGDLDHLLGPQTDARRTPDGALAAVELVPEAKDALKAAFEPLLSRSALATYLMRRYKSVVMGWVDGARALTDGDAAVAAPPPPPELDTAEATERLAFVLTALTRNGPVLVLDVPELRYQPARQVESAAPAVSAVYRAAAARAGARYVDAGPELVAAYRATGRPGHGFDDVQPGYGHLNAEGHAAVARALAAALTSTPERP